MHFEGVVRYVVVVTTEFAYLRSVARRRRDPGTNPKPISARSFQADCKGVIVVHRVVTEIDNVFRRTVGDNEVEVAIPIRINAD